MPPVQWLSSAHMHTLLAHSNSYHSPRQQNVQHGDVLMKGEIDDSNFSSSTRTGTLLLAAFARRAKYSF